MVVNPPGTIIKLSAEVTCNGSTTSAETLLVVVKPHKFRYAPSAASIKLHKGTLVSFVFNGERMTGILLADGRVFKDGVVYTPERW